MPDYPTPGPLCPDAHLVEFITGLYGATLPLLRREVASVLYDNSDPHRSERIWKVSPAEIYRCRDGWVFVNAIEDDQ